MALKTVFDLKNSIAGLLSGMDLSNVDNLNGAIERSVRTMCQKIDIPEASHIQNITLYDGVFDYACDTTIFGTAITDIRPQGISRSPSNFTTKIDQEDFDRTKGVYFPSGTTSTFQYNNGTPIIRILAPFPKQKAVIDPMTATTGWTAGGSASGLAQDTTNFYQSPASLRFTLTGNSVGTLSKTYTSIDLSTYKGVGVGFLAIEVPTTATNLTSIELRIGSDASNYNSVSATTGFLGSWVANNWLLVAFDFATATTTGTPNWSALTYVEVLLTHGATLTNFRLGGLWLSFPTPAQILFQSAAVFLPIGSTTPLTTITLNTDQIILSDPAYTIMEYEGAISICQQTGGTAGSAMISSLESVLNGGRTRTGQVLNLGLYDLYRGDNPSEVIRKLGSWYDNDIGYGSSFHSNW
jgi:hypothetical protein